MKRNIAYKADGTEETGRKIIDALMGLGGINSQLYIGVANDLYFFIDHTGLITSSKLLPFCYELKSLEEQQNIVNAIEDIKIQLMELLSKL